MAAKLITIEQALEEVLAAVEPLSSEQVGITQALGRVLAQDIRAAGDVPPFPSSAMDGYAVQAGPAGRDLRVVAESRAGLPSTHRVAAGEAIRISTGAAVPAGADAVIRQEDVAELDRDRVRILGGVAEGENVRPAGEVMAAGSPVLFKGTTLGPPELAAAIGAGAGQVAVSARPRAYVLSTGDELRPPGDTLEAGQIHDSNGPMLAALALRAGAGQVSSGTLPDQPAATQAGLEEALGHAEVVIVAGGVSVGPHDHVKPALAALGVRERFWGVALQPGKPTWFGTRGTELVFGLPGNPVSAAVTFALFVAPAIAALQGALPEAMPTDAVLGASVRRNPERVQAVRVRLEQRDGQLVAIPNGPQGSHVISSLVGADALAMVPPGTGTLESGAGVALRQLHHRAGSA